MQALVIKEFTFAAAHRLPNYEGACHNLHGHEWKFQVAIKGAINKKSGMVLDFTILKKEVKRLIVDVLDHTYLNEKISNPTAENIAYWIWGELLQNSTLVGIKSVTIWETPTSYVKVTSEDVAELYGSEK